MFEGLQRDLLRPEWAERLPPALHAVLFGLETWQWLSLLVLLLASLLIGFVVRRVATGLLNRRYRLVGIEFSRPARRGVRRGVALLVAAGVWTLVLPYLALPGSTIGLLHRMVQLVAVLAAVWLLASLWDAGCDVLLHRAQSLDQRAERLLVPLTRKFVTALIVAAGALAVLAIVGVNVTGVIAGLGIGGLVVALAAKDSVENLFGSLTILFDMPFRLGDWVKIGAIEGIVEEINLRSTRIRTFEDSVITLPNSNLIRASVENFGARRFRRQRFHVRLAHDASPEQVERLVRELRAFIHRMPGAVEGKTLVELNEITEAALGVLVQCHLEAATQDEELRMRSELMGEVVRLVRAQGLRFAAAPPPPTPPPARPLAEPTAESALPKVE